MRTLWSETEAEYHGEFANPRAQLVVAEAAAVVDPCAVGCCRQRTREQAMVEWCDGWIPGGNNTDGLGEPLGELRRRWTEAGRAATGPVIWCMHEPVPDDEIRPLLGCLHALGVDEVLVSFDTTERDEILPVLDRYAQVLATTFA